MYKQQVLNLSSFQRVVCVACCLSLASMLVSCRRQPDNFAPAQDGHDDTAPLIHWTAVAEGLAAARLPVRKSTMGATRFESLTVGQTGIDFAHDWTPPPGYKLEIYNSLPGGGVCIGDYDGDNLPDVFLTQPNVGSRLYRNLGDFRFQDTTESSGTGDNPYGQGATFVDIENDGDLDLYVCNDERPNRLFVNDGHGKFVESAADFGLDFNGASVMMAFADYDRDGDLDGYLVTNRKEPDSQVPRPERRADGSFGISAEHSEFVDVIVPDDGKPRIIKAGQFDHLYRNNGDGTFTDVSEAAGLVGNYWGLAATWWDYDRDGWPDLYVANDFYGPDQLYHNNGDGTFVDVAAAALPHTPWYSMGNDVADINNDGWLDFMGSDMSGTNHYKQKASMGDMSETGWFLTHPTPRQYMRNALYLNTGTGRFMEIAHLAGVSNTDWTWSLKFADLDEDGFSDLFATNGMNRDWTNSDLRNQSDQADSEEEKIQIWLDSPQRRDANLAFRNTDGLRFESVGSAWGLAAEQVSYGAALADLDRDGDLDVIVNNAEQAAGVYRNHTDQTHRVLVRLKGRASNRWGIGTTVIVDTYAGRQVRHLTSSQGYMSANEPLVHFGLGPCTRIDRLRLRWPSGQVQSFADLPADRFYLVSEPHVAAVTSVSPDAPRTLYKRLPVLTDVVHRETPFNDYARQPLSPHQFSQLGPGMAWGDIDGDGDDDVFLSGASGQAGQMLVNQGNGQFVPLSGAPWIEAASCEDMAPLLFDADGDGDLDLYVVSGGVECEPGADDLQDRLYLNNGDGDFRLAPTETLPDLRDSGSSAVAGDFDRDGDLDLFVGGRVIPGEYPLTPNSHLLRNDGGRFTVVSDELAPGLRQSGLVTSALWSDADGDGWLDLLVTHEWGPVKLYRNDRGRLQDQTAAAGLADLSGWYNSITGGDLDGDGDIDYVVGNFGWNTKYHATLDKPTLLYYGDFEQSGRMRLVEAEFEDETLFPIRGKSCSTNAMPFLGNKFERFHDFAVASLQDIYTPTLLKSAHRFAANSLDSGVWRNRGDGHFEFLPLPTMAQASPTFGVLICEANGDGIPDLLLAQNFFGPQAETGRADGGVGLLLTGNGDGTFSPVHPSRSGIVVPADATSACLADIDSDRQPELIISTNDGPCFVFAHAERDTNPLVVVRVSGTGANSMAIGSRVTVQFDDGSKQTSEVAAGGGYLAQSSSELSFGLGTARRLVRIDVVWPNGQRSSVEPSETRGLFVVTQPREQP